MRSRTPRLAALRPLVATLWAEDAGAPEAESFRERVLPTGAMHLVFRLSGPALRLLDSPEDPAGREVGHAVVGGARASAYLRVAVPRLPTVGAQLLPGAARLLLGPPAAAFAGLHVSLDEVWGGRARELRERLAEAAGPDERLELLEAALAARLDAKARLHPAVAAALPRLAAGAAVESVVRETGLSHRRFVELYRDAVGLPPKVHARVLRMRRALTRLRGAGDLAAIALDAGYADQAHMTRELRELAGLPPGAYRRLAPENTFHVPLGPGSIPFKTPGARGRRLPAPPDREDER